jgi:hypothetical protein
VILTEHSEVNSESRRKLAVSNARAAAALDTPPRFVAVALEHRRRQVCGQWPERSCWLTRR